MARISPISRILADYQMDAETLRRQQQDRIESDPVLCSLNEEIRALGMEKLERAMHGQGSELIDERMRQLDERSQTRLKSIGARKYHCARCRDTGIDGDRYCTCLRSRIYREHYGAKDPLNFPVSLDTYDLSVFDSETVHRYGGSEETQQSVARLGLNIARSIVDGIRDHEAPQGLFLHGEPGLGKTWLASALARQAAQEGIDVAFIHAVPLFNVYHLERLGDDVDTRYIESAELLVIDDLGAEPITANVTLEALLRILTYRSDSRLPTVITTNQDDVQVRYGERISSRMRGADFAALHMRGHDLRDTGQW